MMSLIRRLRPYLTLRLRYFPCALLALGEAILHCWPLLLFAFLAPLVLALSSQGRQALLVAGGGIGFGIFALFCLGTVLTGIYARLILDSAHSNARPNRARRFALHCTPQLIAVAACFALPLLLRYGTHVDLDPTLTTGGTEGLRISIGFFLQALAVAGPMFAIGVPALTLGNGRYGLNDDEIAPLLLVGFIYAVTFVATDDTSVLTRFLVLAITLVLVDWFFPRCFMRPSGVQRVRLTALGWIAFVYALGLLWLACHIAADPGGRAAWWGSTEVILIAMLAYLCVGYLLDWGLWWLSRHRCGRANPLLVGALRVAVLAAIALRLLTGSFGDAPLRTIARADNAPRQTASDYIDRWITTRQARGSKERPYPIFIVTSEGGGIRAAYWTATLLAALQDKDPDFADHVLALSGVSGGSVGASIFAALVNRPVQSTRPPCQIEGGYASCARAIGRGDLLSPPLASMLLAEPLHRLTGAFGAPDRAIALEQALERAWQVVMNDAQFAEPYANLATAGSMLVPNATSAETGQRVVVSTLDAGNVFDPAYALDGRPLALSTATLLSARFPAISPAALYEFRPEHWMRIVDGGFADNSGTATGADVLDALDAALRRTGSKERFRPVVIAITNGELPDSAGSVRGGFRSLTLGAFLDPVATLDSVRGAASTRFQAELRARVAGRGGVYLGGLRLIHADADFPLGWMLAPATADVIDARLRVLGGDAQGDFQRVGRLLRSSE